MSSPVLNCRRFGIVTRRCLFRSAAASFLCTPSIVRATSLMRVHSVLSPTERPYAGFARALFHHSLACGLVSAKKDVFLRNRGLSESEAKLMVAHARAQEWLQGA
jgi:hypothetical protein